ncbi:Cof-type HAD-IIB family hydrolase [Streptococcus macacae]|uniref:Cof-like hydrolase n=1 Tax=Streptococcus macacae NCTC 11558 TaxID=764298 RepID=G5JTZ8_9STRE|nr:HAD family hydrolase [Streptococcus macacae]EHJ53178.1 Cof-like hydrolase [Streptococcus macacae NCTC 11558]SUN78366.1 haloacid dehalogenase [Streptococcus macacae NCTC 11558]
MYRLVAFDMDGTLLTSQKTIAKESIEAIAKASSKGKQVVLSTGRALSELNSHREELKDVRYAVTASGAFIYDFQKEKILAKHVLPSQVVDQIRERVQTHNLMVLAIMDGQSYIQRSHYEEAKNYHMGMYKELYRKTAVFVDNISELLTKNRDQFEKIDFYHFTAAERDLSYQALLSDSVIVTKAEVSGLEVTAAGVEKGQGLSYICQEELHIPLEEAIAVGDADNDKSMICQAGLGVAMGNANQMIKQLADVIVKDNDHGGCAQVIDDYLLKK